jgi:hypothetical protein
MNLAQITVVGNLVTDPETRTLADDQHQASCGVRVVLYRSTLDDLLDLPPDLAIDLTRYQPAWLTS